MGFWQKPMKDNDRNIEKIAMTKPNFPATKFIDLDIIGTYTLNKIPMQSMK